VSSAIASWRLGSRLRRYSLVMTHLLFPGSLKGIGEPAEVRAPPEAH
jgi:hypothetical protein